MKFHIDKKYLYGGITTFLVVAASILLYFGIFNMKSLFGIFKKIINILMPILYGGAIAYLINPIAAFFEDRVALPLLRQSKKITVTSRKKKIVRYISIFLALYIFLMMIYALISMVLPEITTNIVSIINNFPRYVDSVTRWIEHLLNNKQDFNKVAVDMINILSTRVENYLENDLLPQLQSILLQFSSGLWEVVTFFKNALIGIIVSIYILADKEVFKGRSKRIIYAFFPKNMAESLLADIRFANKTFGGFISGKLIDSLIIGVLCYIGCSILKIPYVLLVSVIVGVTNVIPFFGPYLGAVPSAFLILLVSPIKCLYFIIFILVLQQFDGNILGPKILGDSTGLSSFMVILAILIGGGLFGIFGMFVGVPVCAVIVYLLNRVIEHFLRKKNLPTDVDHYK